MILAINETVSSSTSTRPKTSTAEEMETRRTKVVMVVGSSIPSFTLTLILSLKFLKYYTNYKSS